MKHSKLAVALATSTIFFLIGCGGSSGGSSATTTDQITLTFIQKRDPLNAPLSSCTLFSYTPVTIDIDGVILQPAQYVYANRATDVAIYIHDNKGEMVGEMLAPNDNGQLFIDKTTIADGGYITILDSPSNNDHFYKALSIDKDLLTSQVIQIDRYQGINSTCYNDVRAPALQTGRVSVNHQEIKVDKYEYLSTYFKSGLIDSSLIDNVSKKADESLLVKSYDSSANNELTGYLFIANLSFSPNILLPVNDSYSWTNTTGVTLNKLDISLSYYSYTYPWLSVNLNTSTFKVAQDEDSYSYQAQGTYNGWNAMLFGAINSNQLDLTLPGNTNIIDAKPSIAGSFVDLNITGSDKIIAKVAYNQDDTLLRTTLNHVVLSVANNDGTVFLPNLSAITNLTTEKRLEATQVFVYNEQNLGNFNSDKVQSLIAQYEDVDPVAIVVTPDRRAIHDTNIATTNYAKFSR